MGFNGTRLLNNKIKINKSKPQWTYLLFILFFFLLILEKVLVTQSSPFLWDSVVHSPPDFVHRILQARLLEWVVIPFSRGPSRLRDWAQVSGIAGTFFSIWATRESHINIKKKIFFFNQLYVHSTFWEKWKYKIQAKMPLWDLSILIYSFQKQFPHLPCCFSPTHKYIWPLVW